MVIEKTGASLVIDPGAYTMPLVDLENVVAIVITHEHADHVTEEQLHRIFERSPDARIFGAASVAAAIPEFTLEAVRSGDTVEVGPFELTFSGGTHAVIHESIPVIDNLAVLVDSSLYYAGDSYSLPGVAVNTLAVPIGAPWLKIGDVMDYVLAVAPRRAIPVHDAVLSQIGKELAYGRIDAVTKRGGGEFFVLEPGESLEL